MKKLFNLSLVAAAVMTIFSCSKEIDQPITEASSAKTFTFNVVNGGVDTKASLNASATAFKWDTDDKVGVYVGWLDAGANYYSNDNQECAVSLGAESATISVEVPDGYERTIYAYYPRTASGTLEIPAEQNGSTLLDAMPMMSSYINIADSEAYGTKTNTINFNNLAGVIEFNVYTTSKDDDRKAEKVQSVKFVANNVGGEYTCTPSAPNPLQLTPVDGKLINVITSTITPATVGTSKTDHSNLVYMVVAPGEYSGAVVTVTTDKAVYTATLPNDLTVSKNKIIPFNINLNNFNFERVAHTEITLGSDWNTLFGTSYSGTFNPTANSLTLEGNSSIVSITVKNGGATSGYVNIGDFRLYNKYTMTISVPTEVKIVSITSTVGGKNFSSGIEATTGNLSISNNAIDWTGYSSSVDFNITGTISFATITVTLALGSYVIPEYNVIYNENKPAGAATEVSGMPENAKSYSGRYALSTTIPTLDGYVFKGWGATNDADAEHAITSVTIDGADVTVYAIWEKKGTSPETLFKEGFGDNSSSARVWDDEYKEQSGIESVYSGSSYTITNAKQSKNTVGQTKSGLAQSSSGTDASFVVGPLKVADYTDLSLTYYWNAASIKASYSTKIEYSLDNLTYTEVSHSAQGATTFVEVSVNLPIACQSNNLYLKITFNTSNTQAVIDEVTLSGVSTN